jgi:hypothetical protein
MVLKESPRATLSIKTIKKYCARENIFLFEPDLDNF